MVVKSNDKRVKIEILYGLLGWRYKHRGVG